MTDRTTRLVERLGRHHPADPIEARSLHRVRALVHWLPRPFDEDADPTHVTASAIVADGEGRVVLHLHRRLGVWLQPGGHVDADEEPEQAAIREVEEETGIRATLWQGSPEPIHVDVHEGGRGHLHLDLRYLLLAPPGTPLLPPSGESQVVEWLPYADAAERADGSARAAIDAARRRLRRSPR